MVSGLELTLLLLGSAVLGVVAFRMLHLPPMLGYLAVGILIGPHALGMAENDATTHALAEFGVVFLMFSIGLEFSLSQLMAMRRIVFGLGMAQVVLTIVATMVFGWLLATQLPAVDPYQLAGLVRAGRRAGDVVDRDRLEDADRAARAGKPARAQHHRHPAVPGPGGGAAADPDSLAGARSGRTGENAGLGQRQGQSWCWCCCCSSARS